MTRGGKRKGAGRPKNSGKWGEPTKAVRLPVSKIDKLMKILERNGLDAVLQFQESLATDPETSRNISER